MNPPLYLAWQFRTGAKVNSSPAVAGNTVYFGSMDGYLYAVDATTGALKWRYDGGGADDATGLGIQSSPCVDNGVVYVGTRGGHLLAINATTGARVWDVAYGGQNLSSPVVGGGLVYFGVGYPVKAVVALRTSDGGKVWETPESVTGQFVLSSPALDGGRVYVGCDDGNYYALDAATGSRVWSFHTAGGIFLSSPAVDSGRVFCTPGDSDRNLYALSTTTGTPLWQYAVPAQLVWGMPKEWSCVSSPSVSGDTVYFVGGSPNVSLYALNVLDGAKRWDFAVGSDSPEAYASSPVVAGSTVYVGSWSGKLYGVDTIFGTQKWSYQLPDGIGSSPAVSNGCLYVGCNDGNLYAFKSASALPTRFASPTGFVHRGWNLVSLPGVPQNPDPLTVFAGLDIANSSLMYWRNDLPGGEWDIYRLSWNGPVTVGTPYWFLHQGNGGSISFQGDLVTTDQTISIPAHAGAPYWAMFGQPMNHRTSCLDIRFSTGSNPTRVDWATANRSHLVDSGALGNDPLTGAFFQMGPDAGVAERTVLEPWYGYWLLVETTDQLNIHIPAIPPAP